MWIFSVPLPLPVRIFFSVCLSVSAPQRFLLWFSIMSLSRCSYLSLSCSLSFFLCLSPLSNPYNGSSSYLGLRILSPLFYRSLLPAAGIHYTFPCNTLH